MASSRCASERVRHGLAVLAAWLALATASVGAAQPEAASEYELKAAFLYNFARFVEWPDAALPAGARLTICVLGSDPFGPVLEETIADKQVAERGLVVRRLAPGEGPGGCHILFVSAAEEAAFARVVPALAPLRVLTVGEAEDFAERGGMIQLVTRDRKIRFRINVDAADAAGLRISSQLLRLADVVTRSGAAEDR